MHTTRDKHALEDLRSAGCRDERTPLCMNELELYRTGSRYILYDMFQHTSHIRSTGTFDLHNQYIWCRAFDV